MSLWMIAFQAGGEITAMKVHTFVSATRSGCRRPTFGARMRTIINSGHMAKE